MPFLAIVLRGHLRFTAAAWRSPSSLIAGVQATIDAIDRAITDERSIKDKGKPVSLVDRVMGQ